jgi:NADPH2:quinone reductase
MVLFGGSSGIVPPFEPIDLSLLGSLYLTRPSLAHYTQTREELDWRAGEIYTSLISGNLKLRIEQRYPLAEVVRAHQDLESRKTTGKGLLIP